MNLLTYLFAIGNIVVTIMMAYNHETSRWCSFWDGCLFSFGILAFFGGQRALSLLFIAPAIITASEDLWRYFKRKKKT